ncbi:protein of unknown function [Prosthecobacter debontii]|uniref:DnaJ homologue subfamily C member 28 conserved domain-containing protein n=1 Tax=Prosthecobacter debontii TaxID=48467 RepID=A0A1T4YMW0_9BACT|nr:DnaJ family domain-containing protein [Prosthecobacter debontii]SKB03139.1 protein of unknown function [Prosthecobacter debontii]
MSSLLLLAETRIQEALEAGEDQALVCRGKSLDLEAYFAAPSGLRSGFGLLKSAGVVPPEIEAMREVQMLKERLDQTQDPAKAAVLRKELQTREVELAMGLERMKRALKADASMRD